MTEERHADVAANTAAPLEDRVADELVTVGATLFLPADAMEAFTAKGVIEKYLSDAEIPRSGELAQTIIDHGAKRLFLLAVTVKNVQWLVDLVRNPPISDDHLPVQIQDRAGLKTLHARMPLEWPIRGAALMHELTMSQWRFLAPVFTTTKFHYELQRQTPLPFSFQSADETTSGFSIVRRVKLHHAHQSVINLVSILQAFEPIQPSIRRLSGGMTEQLIRNRSKTSRPPGK